MASKSASGSRGPATPVPPPVALVNSTKPSTTAFGCALDADLRLVQVLQQLLSSTSKQQSALSDKTKASAQDVLKDANDQLIALAVNLDDLHMGLCEMDPSGAVRPALEERLRKASDAANAIAIGLRVTQSKNSELAKQRTILGDVQKRISKLQQQHQDYAKATAQLQSITDTVATRREETEALEATIKERKQELQAKEAEISRSREEKHKEIHLLRAEYEKVKTPIKKTGGADTKTRVDELRARINELTIRLETVREDAAQNEAMFKQGQSSSSEAPTTTTTPAEGEVPKAASASSQKGAAEPGPDDPAEPCGVCTRRLLVNDMVMLFNCMHYVCKECMRSELTECRQNNRSFKFAICPSCAEDVEMFDGTGISGTIRLNKDNVIVPVLTEDSA